ncbi:amidohydrolase family protein [Chloroflexota bacterium]
MKKIENRLYNTLHPRIDVHHHILPPEYILALERIGVTVAPLPEWTAQKSLDIMDEHGIAAAITSISTPGVYFKDSSFSRDLARQCNEYSAKLMIDNPGRFGAFASLPLPDVEGSLRELEYAMDTLKLDGVVLMSNVEGRYLGDPAYSEIFTELNRRKTVVFIHPNDPPSSGGISDFVEYPYDATRAVASLMYAGVLDRYSKIRFVLAHAGGTVPFSSFRISAVGMEMEIVHINSILKLLYNFMRRTKALKRMYYDTAASTDIYALRALASHAKQSHLLFGTNYMWTPGSVIPLYIKELKEYDGFSERVLATIERENALDLFPRLNG